MGARTVDARSGRPRIRLQSPTIVFRPSANLRPDKERLNEALEDHHLPSGVPAPVNLLESLKGDPAAEGVNPSLLASRLSGTISKTNGEEFSDNFLRVGAQKPFSALPAISSRIRYSRAICPPGRLSVIAALEIEIAPFSENLIEIAAVDMQLSEGYAENIGKAHGVSLPLIYRSKDNPVFLFRLTPNEAPQGGSNPSSTKTTLISVLATVLLAHTCHPSIEMRWRTGVDFSTAPVYGAFGQSMQTYTRPSSLARTPSTANVDILPTPARHEETSSTSADNISRSRPAYVSDFGIAITFTSPKTVRVGEPFSWNILVLNRSNKPRQLDLSVLPKRRSGGHSSNPSSSSVGGRKESDSADVVIEESLLYAMQRNSGHDTPQVISLSTDVRVRQVSTHSLQYHALIVMKSSTSRCLLQYRANVPPFGRWSSTSRGYSNYRRRVERIYRYSGCAGYCCRGAGELGIKRMKKPSLLLSVLHTLLL